MKQQKINNFFLYSESLYFSFYYFLYFIYIYFFLFISFHSVVFFAYMILYYIYFTYEVHVYIDNDIIDSRAQETKRRNMNCNRKIFKRKSYKRFLLSWLQHCKRTFCFVLIYSTMWDTWGTEFNKNFFWLHNNSFQWELFEILFTSYFLSLWIIKNCCWKKPGSLMAQKYLNIRVYFYTSSGLRH